MKPSRISERSRRRLLLVALLAMCLTLMSATAAAQGPSWDRNLGDVVYSVDMSADASIQIAGSRNNLVTALDQAGNILWEFEPGGTVWGVATSDDGAKTVVASEDRTVYALDHAGNVLWEFPGNYIFLDVAITGDGSMAAAVAEDRNVYALDGGSGDLLWQVPLPNVAESVAMYGNQKARVLVGTRDSAIHLLNTDGSELWRAQLSNTIKGVDAVRNGSKVVASTEAGDIVLLNGANTEILWHSNVAERLNDVAITADGSQIVTGSKEGEFFVIDGASGEVLQSQSIGAAVEAVAVSPDGRFFMTGSRDGRAAFADTESAASQFANRQRLQTGLKIGVPTLVLLLGLALILWLRLSTQGQYFWNVRAAKPRATGSLMWRHRTSYLFLIPTVTLLLVFNYYPAISGLYHSFTVWKPGVETRWVGLEQFRYILNDAYFWVGIKNAVILVITGYIKVLTVPLLVAELLFAIRNHLLQYGMRSLFIIPLVVPGVVGILVWVNIYDPNIGLLNQTLNALGAPELAKVWLGDAQTALASIIGIGFPWVSPFALLIFYGGLISIPQELFDAAKVDGASLWTRFWRLDLPLLMSQIKLLLILGFIGSIQEFQLIFLTTGGGPGNVTYTPALELYYQAVRFNNFGLASAIGAVLFIVILVGTVFYMRALTSAIEYEA